MGGNFLGLNLPGGILYRGNLPEFLYQILFGCLTSSLPANFTYGDVMRNCPGEIFTW